MANATFPNPDTYLNHLSPAEANEFEVARDVYLAVLGAATWDILIYVPEDIKILRGNLLSLVTWCFILSRVFAVAYALLFVVMQTHSIANCHAAQIAVEMFCLPSMACASFLFLRRLEAVYAESRTRIVQWVFRILWFAISVNTITAVVGVRAEHIEGTSYCVIYKVKGYAAVNQFLPAVFDTLVFLAISYKIISSRSALDSKINWRTIVTGKALPRLSRALLHGGQQYYCIVFGVNVIAGVLLYAPSVPVIYRPMLTLASTTLTASMACRVYRNLKTLNCDREPSTLPVVSHLKFVGNTVSSRSTPPPRTSPSIILIGGPDQGTKDHEPDLQIIASRHSWTSTVPLRSDDRQADETSGQVATVMLSG
ncbi:hypothetical protein P691DRAFT_765241 [Macrolepiota fuliginosa MF-IS2]|uniref:Transmembrane protein n=1 Tax=Macrolepiota fuliginosa MF-IS2 TaxID=1400762 RepID=A0A9P6BWX7_9AGAR|nr:hypothetical protein P691DRAFT_765241 [Macrolepiota fuliginosa MF-IS2]